MPEKIQSSKIICEGGLFSNQNILQISDIAPGSASVMINYEPSLLGGYRRINGYIPLAKNFNGEVDPTNAEGPVLCVAIFKSDVITARKQRGSNSYKFYRLQGDEWVAYSSSLTFNSLGVDTIRFATFNFNNTDKIIFVDGTNFPLVYDGTTWTQIKSTVTTPNSTNFGGPMVIDRPQYVTVFKNHIFLAGDRNYPALVAHSAPLNEGDWTAASGAGQLGMGYPVTQIKPFRDLLYVFGFNKIKSIGVSNATFLQNDVATNIGCIAPDSVIEINGDLMFLSQDGIRPLTATERINDIEIGSVSRNIQQLIRQYIDQSDLESVFGVVIPSKSQMRFFFTNGAVSVEESKGILAGLKSGANGEMWEWGELRGIRASCVTSGYILNKEFILHGDFDGVVYRQEQGNNFNGGNVRASFSTPYIDFGDATVRKTIRKVTAFFRAEGSVDVAMGVRYDWNQNSAYAVIPRDYVMTEMGSVGYYEQIRYDQGARYSSSDVAVIPTNVQGSFDSIQFVFLSDNKEAPHSIQGMLLEFSVNGRS